MGLVVAIPHWDDDNLMIPVQWCSWDGFSCWVNPKVG